MNPARLLATLSLCFATLAGAQEDKPSRQFRHALSISPLSAILGGLAGNYEYLAAGKHGVVVEGAYTIPHAGMGGGSGGAAYRYHWDGGMGSGFFGPFVRAGSLETRIEDEDKNKHDVALDVIVLGMNVGRKWQWDRGFDITIRGGYGIPLVDIAWESTTPKNVDFFETVLTLASGLDLEASVGWAF